MQKPTDDLIGLGRRAAKDERDKKFLIPKRRISTAPSSLYWYSPGVYDQGATSQCVAYSGMRYLVTSPVRNPRPWEGSFERLYDECQQVDEWPGTDYDGTSVRALFKVLKRDGYVSEYRWAFDCETVISHVLTTGPVVMGTVWTMDMFTPLTGSGFIVPEGQPVGGHAWLIIGCNRNMTVPRLAGGGKGAVRMINSWGAGWGENGRAWVSFKHLDQLIRDDGEACVATEILR